MAFVRILSTLVARQGDRQASSCRSCPMNRRTFGMEGLVPPARHLLAARPALQAAGRRSADVLSGGQVRADAAGGHQRGRRDVVVDRRRDFLQHKQRADDSRSTSTIRCSACSASAISPGPRATCAAADFLLGGTAGRTTLNGEGLQHEDGHSHIIAATIPNCVSYDPTFAYEVAVIIQDGLRRMFKDQEDVYYYITLMNENYPIRRCRTGAEEGIRRGMYLLRMAETRKGPRVQLLGSRHHPARSDRGADLLAQDFGVAADVWSCPSFNELRRDGLDIERWNLLHPAASPAQEPCRGMSRRTRKADRGCDRLYAHLPRSDPAFRSSALCVSRHRWLRTQRLSRRAAQILRGRPPLRRCRRAQGARRRGHACRRTRSRTAIAKYGIDHRKGHRPGRYRTEFAVRVFDESC